MRRNPNPIVSFFKTDYSRAWPVCKVHFLGLTSPVRSLLRASWRGRLTGGLAAADSPVRSLLRAGWPGGLTRGRAAADSTRTTHCCPGSGSGRSPTAGGHGSHDSGDPPGRHEPVHCGSSRGSAPLSCLHEAAAHSPRQLGLAEACQIKDI